VTGEQRADVVDDETARPARWAALATTLGAIAVAGVLVVLVARAPVFAGLRQHFFRPHDLKANGPSVLRGFALDVRIVTVAGGIALVLGVLAALAGRVRSPAARPLRALALVYVTLFRAVPPILLVFVLGFGVPSLGYAALSSPGPFVYGTLALGLIYAAHVAHAIGPGKRRLDPLDPVAAGLGRAAPELVERLTGLIKDSPLLLILGIRESVGAAASYASLTYTFLGFGLAAILFLAVTIPLGWLSDRLAEQQRMEGTPHPDEGRRQ
jgi:polar amino acid transport system permease protein